MEWQLSGKTEASTKEKPLNIDDLNIPVNWAVINAEGFLAFEF